MKPLYYKLENRQPIPIASDAREIIDPIFEKDSYRVDFTRIGKIEISTVFLYSDHGRGDDGPPILFETIVFNGPLDGEMERYCTWDEAEVGHLKMVQRVRALEEEV
jgi:hypothetical protein